MFGVLDVEDIVNSKLVENCIRHISNFGDNIMFYNNIVLTRQIKNTRTVVFYKHYHLI